MVTMYDAEHVEIIMMKHPEYFTPKYIKTTIPVAGPFGMEYREGEEVKTSIAEYILNTANATKIKYGNQRAINYINRIMKTGPGKIN